MLIKVVKYRKNAWYNRHIGETFYVEKVKIDDQGEYYALPSKDEYDGNMWYFDTEDVVEFNRYEKLTKILDRIKNNT